MLGRQIDRRWGSDSEVRQVPDTTPDVAEGTTRPETPDEKKTRHEAEDKEDEKFSKEMMTMSEAFGNSRPNMQGGKATYKAASANLTPTAINNPFFK